MKRFAAIFMTLILLTVLMSVGVSAAEIDTAVTGEAAAAAASNASNENDVLSAKAIGAAVVVGLVGAGAAIGMGMTISKSAESMARQPEMADKINSTMMLGIVFIETAIIYALVVAILIIFVL